MSCNSMIHTVNQTNQEVSTTAGTFVQVPFGTVIRRFGPAIRMSGMGIACYGSGYFDVTSSVGITPTAAGPITAQIRQGNEAVPGMSVTVQGAAGEPIAIPLVGAIRNCGCDCNSALSLWIDAPCNATNISTRVEKI